MCSLIEEPVKITKEAFRDKFLKKTVQAKSENWVKSLSTPSRQFDLKASAWCFGHHYLDENSISFHYVATGVWLLLNIWFKSQSKDIFVQINGILTL